MVREGEGRRNGYDRVRDGTNGEDTREGLMNGTRQDGERRVFRVMNGYKGDWNRTNGETPKKG